VWGSKGEGVCTYPLKKGKGTRAEGEGKTNSRGSGIPQKNVKKSARKG